MEIKDNEDIDKASKELIDKLETFTSRLPYIDYYLKLRMAKEVENQYYYAIQHQILYWSLG